MALMTSISDAEVEPILGPVLGSWEPLPLKEICKSACPPTTSVNGCLVSVLSMFPFFTIIAAAITAGVYFRSLLVGIVVAFALGIPVSVLATRFSREAHRRTRLGVFERGMRFGRSVIRFDELKVVTFGAPKTFTERHMPNLRRGQKALENPSAEQASLKAERSRKLALTFVLNNGKHVVWLSFHASFSKETITAFFELLDQHIHEQLRGLNLTREERQQIEDL